MADELTRLGVSWQDESEVRQNVAAAVAADASAEAFQDQEALAAAWKELRNAEGVVDQLERLPLKERDSTYARRLELATEDLRLKSKAVQSKQIQLEKNKQQRLKEAKMRALQSIAADAVAKEAVKVEPIVAVKAEGGMPAAYLTSSRSGEIARRMSTLLHRHAAPARRVGEPSEAVKDYQGGAVLDAVHSVEVTRSDRAAAAGKYLDDGDVEMFASRQEAIKSERREEKRAARAAFLKAEADARAAASIEATPLDDNTDELDPLSDLLSTTVGDDDDDNDGGDDDEDMIAPISQLPAYKISLKIHSLLLDYQKVGLEWLVGLHHRRTGGILGDEMGLGKTVQIAALLNMLCSSKQLLGPALIVAPLTVLSQWVKELHRWSPQLRTCILHSSGTSSTLEGLVASVRNKPAAVITTYATMTIKCDLLHRANFQYVILDEGHKICNPEAGMTMAAKTFVTPHRLILTGSPIQNTLKELWCLFDFARPGLLGLLHRFVAEFEEPINASRSPRATKLETATAIECARVLQSYIQPFLLRRMKKDVNAMLPAKYERVIRCSLTDAQLEAYVGVLKSQEVQALLGSAPLHQYYTGGLDRHGRDATGSLWTGSKQFSGRRGISTGQRQAAFRVLHVLRNLCNHIDIFNLKHDDAEEGAPSGKYLSFRSNNPVRYEGSGKLATLRKLLVHWKAGGHKVLVFSQYRMMLDILENMCEQEKHTYIRMDGTTPSKNRAILIDKFNTDDTIFVALLTTKVGGLGVNLTGADRVVIFDPDWNPVNDEQARERAWRIGQTREVCVYRMISSGSIEETILHRQLAKTYVTEKVLNDPTLQRCFSMHSFVDAFYLGSEYVDRIPPHARHVISTVGDLAAVEADAELDRENEETLAPLVERRADGSSESLEHDRRLQLLGGQRSGSVGGGATFRVTEHRVVRTSVKQEENSAASRQDSSAELNILQSMMDGERPATAAAVPLLDRVGRGLAAITARETLQRAVERTPLHGAQESARHTPRSRPSRVAAKRERDS